MDLSSHTDDNKKEAYNKDRIIVKAGKPIAEIVATAKKDNFDLIIMGTHGHGDLEEIMLGSTANGVIQKSSVPVLIARPI